MTREVDTQGGKRQLDTQTCVNPGARSAMENSSIK